MTDKQQTRRRFVRTTAGAGLAAAGLAGLGGQAAAQNTNVNANSLFSSGLVVVQGVNVQDTIDIEDITVEDVDVTVLEVGDVTVNVEDVDVLNDNVIKILNDVDVEDNLNQNQVTVQVSILGDVVGTDVVNVPGNLR